jgi:LysM repeat protein
MTSTGDAPEQPSLPEDARGRFGRHRGPAAVLEVCPYLAAADGRWRSAYATRDHRCGALRPPAALAVSKQRELCLGASHRACATYLVAQRLAADAGAGSRVGEGAALWGATRTTPLVLDPVRRLGPITASPTRAGGQALLAGLMVVAFVVLVVARNAAPVGPGAPSPAPTIRPAAVASQVATASAAASPTPSVAPSGSPSPSSVASPSVPPSVPPTAEPTAAPSRSPAPSPRPALTYKVKSGDTLSSIAAKFGTTVRALKKLNGIDDPKLLRTGQVLIIR